MNFFRNLIINEMDESKLIGLYPNPVKNEFIINAIETAYKIEVIDCLGKVILECTDIPTNNKINLDNLKNGLYYVNVFLKTGVNRIKILKQ